MGRRNLDWGDAGMVGALVLLFFALVLLAVQALTFLMIWIEKAVIWIVNLICYRGEVPPGGRKRVRTLGEILEEKVEKLKSSLG